MFVAVSGAGWGIAVAHLTAAVVQAATIVGIPTAVTSVELAAFALCATFHSDFVPLCNNA